jgi:hypothetical protein
MSQQKDFYSNKRNLKNENSEGSMFVDKIFLLWQLSSFSNSDSNRNGLRNVR